MEVVDVPEVGVGGVGRLAVLTPVVLEAQGPTESRVGGFAVALHRAVASRLVWGGRASFTSLCFGFPWPAQVAYRLPCRSWTVRTQFWKTLNPGTGAAPPVFRAFRMRFLSH